MNEDKYLAESSGFDAGGFHSHKVPPAEMELMFHAVEVATQWADRVKRALFYGADLDQRAVALPTSLSLDSKHRDLIHGILGMFTEAGELMEHLHAVLRGETNVDIVNLVEELGDSYWYAAILHRITHTKPSEAMYVNIVKLTARYPERFTEYAALNRDLGNERAMLEKSTAEANEKKYGRMEAQ